MWDDVFLKLSHQKSAAEEAERLSLEPEGMDNTQGNCLADPAAWTTCELKDSQRAQRPHRACTGPAQVPASVSVPKGRPSNKHPSLTK